MPSTDQASASPVVDVANMAGDAVKAAVPGLQQAEQVGQIATQSIQQISSDIASIAGFAQQGSALQLQGELGRALETYGVNGGNVDPQYISLFSRFNTIADQTAPMSDAPASAKMGDEGVFFFSDPSTGKITLKKRDWGFDPATATPDNPAVQEKAAKAGVTPEEYLVVARTVQQSSQETTELAVKLAKIQLTANMMKTEYGQNRSQTGLSWAKGGAVAGGIGTAAIVGLGVFAAVNAWNPLGWGAAAITAAAIGTGVVAGAVSGAVAAPAIGNAIGQTATSFADANTAINTIEEVVNSGPPYKDPEIQAAFDRYLTAVYPDAVKQNSARIMGNLAGSTQTLAGFTKSGRDIYAQLNNTFYFDNLLQNYIAKQNTPEAKDLATKALQALVDRESSKAMDKYKGANLSDAWMKYLSHLSQSDAEKKFAAQVGAKLPLSDEDASSLRALRAKGTLMDVKNLDAIGKSPEQLLQEYLDGGRNNDNLFDSIETAQNSGFRGFMNMIKGWFEGLFMNLGHSVSNSANQAVQNGTYDKFAQDLNGAATDAGLTVPNGMDWTKADQVSNLMMTATPDQLKTIAADPRFSSNVGQDAISAINIIVNAEASLSKIAGGQAKLSLTQAQDGSYVIKVDGGQDIPVGKLTAEQQKLLQDAINKGDQQGVLSTLSSIGSDIAKDALSLAAQKSSVANDGAQVEPAKPQTIAEAIAAAGIQAGNLADAVKAGNAEQLRVLAGQEAVSSINESMVKTIEAIADLKGFMANVKTSDMQMLEGPPPVLQSKDGSKSVDLSTFDPAMVSELSSIFKVEGFADGAANIADKVKWGFFLLPPLAAGFGAKAGVNWLESTLAAPKIEDILGQMELQAEEGITVPTSAVQSQSDIQIG